MREDWIVLQKELKAKKRETYNKMPVRLVPV
jgi:hypothetical protein